MPPVIPPDKTELLYESAHRRFRATCELQEDGDYPAEVIAENLARYFGALAAFGIVSAPGRPAESIQPAYFLFLMSALKRMERPGFALLESRADFADMRREWLREVNHHAKAPKRSQSITAELLVKIVNARAFAGGMALAVQRDMALAMVSYFAAGRQSEISGLRLCDVVERTDGFELQIRTLKTRGAAEFRQVIIPRHADGEEEWTLPFLAVHSWLRSRRETEPPPPDDANVFVHIRPTRANNLGKIDGGKGGLSHTGVNKIWRKMLAAAGVPAQDAKRFSAHGARRGRATDAARHGGSALVVAQIGGWKDLDTLARHYIDPVAAEEFVRQELATPDMRRVLQGGATGAPAATPTQEKIAAAGGA